MKTYTIDTPEGYVEMPAHSEEHARHLVAMKTTTPLSVEYIIALYRVFDKVTAEGYLTNPGSIKEPEVSWVDQEMELMREEEPSTAVEISWDRAAMQALKDEGSR